MYTINPYLRAIARITMEIIHRLFVNLFDTLFGFLNWPKKRIRVKVLILRPEHGDTSITPADLDSSLKYAINIFKERFNVYLLPAKKNVLFTEVLESPVPHEALFTSGGNGALKDEWGIAGNVFAANLVAPVYPLTAFVVIDMKDATGCSLGPMTDYITISHEGIQNETVLAHEIAHACGLWHLKDKTNLLWPTGSRGSTIRWWQKNIFRSSRHVTYW